MIQDESALWREEEGGSNGGVVPSGGGRAGSGSANSVVISASESNVNENQSFDSGILHNNFESLSKTIKLTPPDHDHRQLDEQAKMAQSICSSFPPLGLKLVQKQSLAIFLDELISQQNSDNLPTHKIDQTEPYSLSIAEKIKAANFPAKLLRIGSWERASRYEGDLVVKFYYVKKKLVWEFLEKSLKRKIEIQWSDVLSIRAFACDKQPGILEIELNQPPTFHHEINPQPRRHTIWSVCSDFTGGQAPICRRHYLEFAPGVMDKHYEKLLQYEKRFFDLSQQHFPSLKSPYFQSITNGNTTNLPLDNYTNVSQLHDQIYSIDTDLSHNIGSKTNHQPPSVEHLHQHQQYVQSYDHQQIIHDYPSSSVAKIPSTSPHPEMGFSHNVDFINDGMAGNHGMAAIRSQVTSNCYDYLARDQVPRQMMINHTSATPSSVHYQNNYYMEENIWSNDNNMLVHNVDYNQLWANDQIPPPDMINNQPLDNTYIRQLRMTYALGRFPTSLDGDNPFNNQANYGSVSCNGFDMGLQQLINDDNTDHCSSDEFSCLSAAARFSGETLPMQFRINHEIEHSNEFPWSLTSQVPNKILPVELQRNFSMYPPTTDDVDLVNN